MTSKIQIVLHEGADKQGLYSLVTKVVSDYPHRPKLLLVECTDEQYAVLQNHPDVHHLVDYNEMKANNQEVECATKLVSYKRLGSFGVSPTGTTNEVNGNWGLIRHSSATNNTSFNSQINNATHTYNYDGTGVDIILNIASVLDLADPEFKTNNVTRINQYQWNTLSGMSTLPTVDYSKNGSDINSHAESVSYLAVSNTYGWATGANIYIWPRDQMSIVNPLNPNDVNSLLDEYGWDCFRLFHQNKTNNRPTVVLDSILYPRIHINSNMKGLMFRDTSYEVINPSGSGKVPITFMNREARGGAFGLWHLNTMDNAGYYGMTSLGSLPTDAEIISFITTPSNDPNYAGYVEPIEDMTAAGVHHISAAGNNGVVQSLPDSPDYNNGVLYYNSTSVTAKYGLFYPTNRPNFVLAGDTIACGALGSSFNEFTDLGTKESLANFSNRGDRVDCCAAGENIVMDLRSNGHYLASGTSFASPQIAGMACMVLEKYPSTTPAQLRKYFREHAVGTDTLYDSGLTMASSSEYGDEAWFNDYTSVSGYSGKIAYLDPSITFDPSGITDTTITSSLSTADRKLNYTNAQINTKLATIP